MLLELLDFLAESISDLKKIFEPSKMVPPNIQPIKEESGLRKCSRCGITKLQSEFSNHCYCKTCKKEYQAKYKAKKREDSHIITTSDDVLQKNCGKCGQNFPLTEEYWYKSNFTKSGWRAPCKACIKNYQQQYNLNDPTQTCNKCGKTKPLTPEFWSKEHTKLGFRRQCKECQKISYLKWQEKKAIKENIIVVKETTPPEPIVHKEPEKSTVYVLEGPGPKAILNSAIDSLTCKKCGKTLPRSEEFWYRSNTKSGWKTPCRACTDEIASNSDYTYDSAIVHPAETPKTALPVPPVVLYRTCTICQKKFPVTEESFAKGPSGKYNNFCNNCGEKKTSNDGIPTSEASQSLSLH